MCCDLKGANQEPRSSIVTKVRGGMDSNAINLRAQYPKYLSTRYCSQMLVRGSNRKVQVVPERKMFGIEGTTTIELKIAGCSTPFSLHQHTMDQLKRIVLPSAASFVARMYTSIVNSPVQAVQVRYLWGKPPLFVIVFVPRTWTLKVIKLDFD